MSPGAESGAAAPRSHPQNPILPRPLNPEIAPLSAMTGTLAVATLRSARPGGEDIQITNLNSRGVEQAAWITAA